MGIEKENATLLRNTKVRQAILGALQLGGTLTLAILAPNALSLLGRKSTRSNLTSAKSAVRRLASAGLIEFKDGKNGTYLQVTDKGNAYIFKTLGNFHRPKKWDKKWRVVIFDIPESRRNTRVKLRNMLVEIGFKLLQRSVWVYPHDCEELITILKIESRLNANVLYMIVDKIENDKNIRAHFGLPMQR